MKNVTAAVGLVLCLLLMMPGAGEAQDYRGSVGWTLGAQWTSGLNAGVEDAEAIEPGLGALGSLFYDHWWTQAFGFRGEGTYAWNQVPWTTGDRDVYSWSVSGQLVLRLAGAPGEGRAAYPFLAAGVGGLQHRLGDGPAAVFDEGAAVYAGDEKLRLIGVGSVGVDVPLPWNWSEGPMLLRLQASDQMLFNSPLEPLSDDLDEFDPVHVFQLSVGLHTGVGVIR